MDDHDLRRLASRYVWWRTPDDAIRDPTRLFTQVMNFGTYGEVEELVTHLGRDKLREVLVHAESGEFDERSWVYWHYRLGLATIDDMPPLPVAAAPTVSVFKPRANILTPAQRRWWHELGPTRQLGFVLYGGAAIALRLGHRQSGDLDFFTHVPLDKGAIQKALPFTADAEVRQDRLNTFSIVLRHGGSADQQVKISFFGGLPFGRVADPDVTDDGVVQVAGLDDLMAHKTKVIRQRHEAKDYRDIAAMIEAGVSVGRGVATARHMFGAQFQPIESLKAMVCFQGGDLCTLSRKDRQTLITAVMQDLVLPYVRIKSSTLSLPLDFGVAPRA
jgi:hypothetical protein